MFTVFSGKYLGQRHEAAVQCVDLGDVLGGHKNFFHKSVSSVYGNMQQMGLFLLLVKTALWEGSKHGGERHADRIAGAVPAARRGGAACLSCASAVPFSQSIIPYNQSKDNLKGGKKVEVRGRDGP